MCARVCVKIVWLTFKIFSKICFLLFARTCIAPFLYRCVLLLCLFYSHMRANMHICCRVACMPQVVLSSICFFSFFRSFVSLFLALLLFLRMRIIFVFFQHTFLENVAPFCSQPCLGLFIPFESVQLHMHKSQGKSGNRSEWSQKTDRRTTTSMNCQFKLDWIILNSFQNVVNVQWYANASCCWSNSTL